MNLDPHWLKEKYRQDTTEKLEDLLLHLEIFENQSVEIEEIKAEIERRREEDELKVN